MCTSCVAGYTTVVGRAARRLWSLADRLSAVLAGWRPATWAVPASGSRLHRDEETRHDPPTASAALLLEVVDAGGRISESDRGRVACTVADQFGLTARQAERVVGRAQRVRRSAPGLQAFTGPLVTSFTRGQREILAELLEELARDAGRNGWEDRYAVRKIRALLRVEVTRV
jgi:uncharacterized tellurite resistance protein B-like protein